MESGKVKRRHICIIRQRDISDCGPACLASVCAYHGLFVSVSAIRQMAGTDLKGTSVLGITEAATRLGLNARGIKATYESLLGSAFPAIVHVVIRENTGHFMVVFNVSADSVVVMDPAEGRKKKIAREEFNKIWTCVAVLLEPGDKFHTNEKKSVLSRIYDIIRPFRKSLLMICVCAAMISLIGLSVSIYLKEILDGIFKSRDMLLLNILSGIVIILLAMQFVIAIMKDRLVLNVSRKVNTSLIMNYYRHVTQLPQSFFDSMRVGEMISRVNDAVKITSFINDVAVNMIIDIMMILFSLVLMFIYNWRIALLIVLVVPVYSILYHVSRSINKKWQRKVMESGAQLDAQLVESLGAGRSIKMLGLEDHFIARTGEKLDSLLQQVYISSVKQSYVYSATDMMTRVFSVLLLWSGSYYVLNNRLTAGELILFYTLLTYFSMPVLYLLNAGKNISESFIAADRLFEIMDLPGGKEGWKSIPPSQKINIEFHNVRFRYGNNEPVLKNLNLKINCGTITGIKGKSGSGKSTIASLLLKLYEPEHGDIIINNINIRELDRKSIVGLIAIAPQQPVLFQGSITENIIIGHSPDRDRLQMVAERLGIVEIASMFAGGMNGIVEEQGSNLSGGQKQRISLARAIYRNAGILILDEATASVDADSEEKIMQTIEWYKNCGNTVIIIAHSNSALKICDNIVVLEDGILK